MHRLTPKQFNVIPTHNNYFRYYSSIKSRKIDSIFTKPNNHVVSCVGISHQKYFNNARYITNNTNTDNNIRGTIYLNKISHPQFIHSHSLLQNNFQMNSLSLTSTHHSLHTSAYFHQEDPKEEFKVLDEKNRIERYVDHQRKKLEQREKLRVAGQKLQEAFIFKVDRSLIPEEKVTTPTASPVPATITKKPLKERIMEEVKHYYNGFRLLYLDVKIAARLLWQVMNGKSLTRRERKQFLRTVADLFRLVPFSVFIIIPFMEFLLPVAIKLFPGMLPSTFEDAKTKESKRRASLKMRIQMAEFLQDTIEEISVTSKSNKPSKKLTDFAEFVSKARMQGDRASNKEIMKYSKLFEDEITLENIAHDQLKAICRLLMISPIGTSNFLRFKIRLKLQELKADDQMIQREGIENLTSEELQNACIARGMRALGVSVDRMKADLKQWLELSLDADIPASLLLLSRTLYMSAQVATVDEQLKVTIGSLPERLIDEMEVKIGAVEGEAVDRQTIIDIIKHEEEQIQAEKLRQKEVEAEEQAKQMVVTEEGKLRDEILKVKETISTDRDELYKIKEDRDEYIEDLQEMKQIKESTKESKASERLGKRIDNMLSQIDITLKDLEEEVSHLPDGKIDKDDDGVVSTQELFEAIQKLRNAPDQLKTHRLLQVLDQDSDGAIELEELRTAVELIATEDLDLDHVQISEVMGLLRGTERIFVLEQMINKKKSNYILRLLPSVYSKKIMDELL